MKAKVLVLEKDWNSAALIQTYLVEQGHEVITVDPDELTPDCKLSDTYDAVIFAEDRSSVTMSELRKMLDLDHQSTFLVIVGADPEVDRAVDTMLEGAYAYLTKPISSNRLRKVLEKGLENKKTLKEIMEMAIQVQESNRQLQNHKRILLREKRQLRFLHKLSLAINGSLDRCHVVDKVFAQLRHELGVCWCRVHLFGSDIGERDWEHAVGAPDEKLEVVSLPLVVGGNALGAMEVALPLHLSRDHRQLFDTMVIQVALALQNANHHAEVKRQADCDALTRLYNRRSFERQLQRELAIHHRYKDDLSLILWDLDNFKQINDLYGHQTGDEALRRAGLLTQETFRNCDYLARWGGDEFAAILPRTTKDNAFYSAERLRSRLQQEVLNSGRNIQLSASFGVADTRSIRSVSKEELIATADLALYRAKRAGRNRVTVCNGIQQEACHSTLVGLKACMEANT